MCRFVVACWWLVPCLLRVGLLFGGCCVMVVVRWSLCVFVVVVVCRLLFCSLLASLSWLDVDSCCGLRFDVLNVFSCCVLFVVYCFFGFSMCICCLFVHWCSLFVIGCWSLEVLRCCFWCCCFLFLDWCLMFDV